MSYIAQVIHHSSNECFGFNRKRQRNPANSLVSLQMRLTGIGFNIMSCIHTAGAARLLGRLWFTVIQPKPGKWTRSFWDSADQKRDLYLPDQVIPLYLWGKGPLVVCLHGWAGSGTQFSYMIPVLVNAGYQVACFDAPSHGQNAGRTAHLLDFSACLSAIQEQYAPVDTVIAHSFGSMATLMAAYQGVKCQQMILVAPGLDVNEIYNNFCEKLNLNMKLKTSVHRIIGNKIREITGFDNPWNFYTPGQLLSYASPRSFMIYDRDDEEIAYEHLKKISSDHEKLDTFVTSKLGHNRILKDESVISGITGWLTDNRKHL